MQTTKISQKYVKESMLRWCDWHRIRWVDTICPLSHFLLLLKVRMEKQESFCSCFIAVVLSFLN